MVGNDSMADAKIFQDSIYTPEISPSQWNISIGNGQKGGYLGIVFRAFYFTRKLYWTFQNFALAYQNNFFL